MTESAYKPCYLDSFTEIDDSHFILNVIPQDEYDEDYYYQIEIQLKSSLEYVKQYQGEYISVDVLSSGMLEIYVGEFYQECISDGEREYTRYLFTKTEKDFKADFRDRFKLLEKNFDQLIKERLPDYLYTRTKVISDFQAIYNQHISSENIFGLSIAEIDRNSLFGQLYNYFPITGEIYGFRDFILKEFSLGIMKSWKESYFDLEAKFRYLKTVNLNNYSLVRDHVVMIYKQAFDRMHKDLLFRLSGVDASKHLMLFNSLVETLKKKNN